MRVFRGGVLGKRGMSLISQFRRDLIPVLRFAAGYGRFVREPVSSPAALAHIQARVHKRQERFLKFVEDRIYNYPQSPYLPLLRAAGCELGDLRTLVARHGLEETLRTLAEAGVRVSIDEFKGYSPIKRGEMRLAPAEHDFDNPYLAHHLEVQSGGTRSAGTRVHVDLEFIRVLAEDTAIAFDAHRLWDATQSLWLPIGGPVHVAMNIYVKLACSPVKWFTQVNPRTATTRERWGSHFMTEWGRWMGAGLPKADYAGLADAPMVALWMAGEVWAGRRPCLTTHASSAVRVCQAAEQEGLDLSRSAFITIGEPLTRAKREVIERVGATVLVRYAVTEAGILGYGCANPIDSDDLHFLSDNLALICHPRPVGPARIPVEGLLISSLLPESPKVLLNMETGDYADVMNRECGCPLGRAGLTTHLVRIRSFEKLTSEGMTFVGTSLIRVLEEVLPARFGGRPTDYQLVESEDKTGMTRLDLRVDPGVGVVDDAQIVETFFAYLDEQPRLRTMVEVWRQAAIVKVCRATPVSTRMGKILPFHLVKHHASLEKPR
jgi:hypothetical protein